MERDISMRRLFDFGQRLAKEVILANVASSNDAKLVDGRLGHVVHAVRSVSPESERTYGVHTYADLLALSVETRQYTTARSPVE